MTSFISSFKFINVVRSPDPKILLRILASAADAAAVNHNLTKRVLANGFSTFFIKGKPVFSNGSWSLSRFPANCTIFDSLVLDNFVLADYLFAKAIRSLKFCLSVNNNLCGKLVSSLKSPVTSYFSTIFMPDFNLLDCELNNFSFKVLHWVILRHFILKQNTFKILARFFLNNLEWCLLLLQ